MVMRQVAMMSFLVTALVSRGDPLAGEGTVEAPTKEGEKGEASAPAGARELTPRDLWVRIQETLPPFTFTVEKDEVVPSDTQPREKLRRVEVKFTSQVIQGKPMNHLSTIFLPADAGILEEPARRGKVVIVGQRWGDASMLFNYGDALAARTRYPTMLVPVPGDFDGQDGEGRWMTFLRDLVNQTKDPAQHNYFRLAVPYLRAMDVFAAILGEKDIKAIIGGHSKRATSAFTAAAIAPERIAGIVYMGNESKFVSMESSFLGCLAPTRSQKEVKCPVLYIGATNEDGYEMFNINNIVSRMTTPWDIAYLPNYRHATASEAQSIDWQMWTAHVFDGRPLSKISDLAHEETKEGTIFRARVESPNKIIHVKFWYVYCDDVPTWRDLVWYPIYPVLKEGNTYEGYRDGKIPDAWFVEVKDTSGGIPGYVSSLPRDLTGKPTKERVSHGWRPRAWEPKP
jgi:hypothetical protein